MYRNTLIPVNSCLLASAKDTNIIDPVKDFDHRTLGELFFFLVDEMTDITFNRSLGILKYALMASLPEMYSLFSTILFFIL